MKKIPFNRGDVYGRLTVESELPPSVGSRSRRRMLCRCSCGKFHEAYSDNLVRGIVKSCGCLHADTRHLIRLTHGMSGSRTYKSWAGMRDRCGNPRNGSYKDYGGRGVTWCDRWDNFSNFLKDMGVRPKGCFSIERIDNDRGYEPGNCRWATPTEQANNRRSNHLLAHQGTTLSISGWARLTGIPRTAIQSRISHGWGVKAALETPLPKRYALKALQKLVR